ncbi:hypothetical protein JYB64_08515 [Algoriphagus aestuarii]|nr:hypothetical protein [Algoriphagus aestuarii]
MRHLYYKIIILILSFIIFVFSYEFSLTDPRSWICFIPLIYGILFYLIAPNPSNVGVGFIMLNLVLIAKYLLFPFFYVNSNYYSPYDSLILFETIKISYWYMMLEMILILVSLRIFYKTDCFNLDINNLGKYSYKLPIFLFFLLIGIFNISPSSYSNFSFILTQEEFIFEKDFLGPTSYIFFIKWSLYIIPLYIFIFFYKKYLINPRIFYFILSIFPLVISTLIYFSNSRLSILIPLLSFWFVLVKFYPKYSKLISLYFLAYGAFSMLLLSLIKFFSVSNINSVSFSYDVGSYFLNSYFHGIPNIALGIQASNQYYNTIKFSNILDELFAQVMFINDYFNVDNRTNYYFNKYIGTNSNIVPTLTEASMLFGKNLFWILTPLFTYLVCQFDRLSFKTSRIDKTFIFCFFSVSIAFFMLGNLNLISDSFFTYFIPIYLLFIVNRIYISKTKIKFK